MKGNDIKEAVKEGYGKIAASGSSCCGGGSCCGGASSSAKTLSKNVGYDDTEMAAVPDGANLGLGCGNPTALASLKEGETVLDLGSGAGFDSFLAAQKVGKRGRVIGVDMTPEMIARATDNARNGGYKNVEFRLGEIEQLPVADANVDVIISNCVINLSPEKEKVFAEAYRVLKKGGRVLISDIVLLKELPQSIRDSIAAYIGCIAGAVLKDDYIGLMKAAGFRDVRIVHEALFPIENMTSDAITQTIAAETEVTPAAASAIASTVSSIKVEAYK